MRECSGPLKRICALDFVGPTELCCYRRRREPGYGADDGTDEQGEPNQQQLVIKHN